MKTDKKYRKLERHEIVEQGDQFQRAGRWLNATDLSFGSRVSDLMNAYRRLIAPPPQGKETRE